MDAETVEINAATKRPREARIFDSRIWKERELEEGQARDLEAGGSLGRRQGHWMMRMDLYTFRQGPRSGEWKTVGGNL